MKYYLLEDTFRGGGVNIYIICASSLWEAQQLAEAKGLPTGRIEEIDLAGQQIVNIGAYCFGGNC